MQRSHVRFLILLLLSLPQAAQNPSTANKAADIQGTVLEFTSNEPIRKALVGLKKGDDPGIATFTDNDGKFIFHDLDPGTYFIAAERTGFVADAKLPAQSITVKEGDAPDPVILKLNRTAAISGRVVDADGEPAVAANIQVQPLNPKKNRPMARYAATDDRGNYRAYNLPPGKYKISVTYSSRYGDPRLKIQAEIDKTKSADPDAYGTTYYPGTLDPAQATTIQLAPGADMQGIDLALLHTKAVRVRGKINTVDGELPAPVVMLALTRVNRSNVVNTQVRPDGSFELADVVPGEYILSAFGLLQHGKQTAAHQRLEVGETDLEGIQLTMGVAQTVTGAVLMPPDRKLPSGLVVLLRAKDSGLEFQNQSGGLAQLTERGTFSLENVLPGDYDFVIGNVGKGDDLYVAAIRSGDQDILAPGLHIAATAPPPVEIILKANGAEIECTVLDDKQTPVPEAHLTLLPDPPRRSAYALRAECQTNASGKCTLLGVAPGDYHAFATSKDDPADFNDPATMESLEKFGKPITVALGDRTSLQIPVIVQSDN